MSNRGEDGWMEGRMSRNSPCFLKDIGPLGPLHRKLLKHPFSHFSTHPHEPTDQRTDRETNGLMDRGTEGVTDGRTAGRMDGQSLL